MILTKTIFTTWALISSLLNMPGAHYRPTETEVNTSIVTVYASGGRGTGFFIEVNNNKWLVTAAHVCGTSSILVSPRGLHRVLAVRSDKDICIATTWQGVSTIEVGSDPMPGDELKMNGFPGDLVYDVQYGKALEVEPADFAFPPNYYASNDPSGCPPLSIIKDKDTCVVYVTTFAADILARGGNSGGPVVDRTTGKLVGMIIGTDNRGKGFAVPVSEIMGLFEGRP